MLIKATDSHPRVTRHGRDAPAVGGIESRMTPRLPPGDHRCVDADGAAPAVSAVPEGSEEGWGVRLFQGRDLGAVGVGAASPNGR